MVQAAPLRVNAVGLGLLPVWVPLKPKRVDAPGASVPFQDRLVIATSAAGLGARRPTRPG